MERIGSRAWSKQAPWQMRYAHGETESGPDLQESEGGIGYGGS